MRKIQIAVIGYNKDRSNKNSNRMAYDVGKAIAQKGAILLCGGLNGVMEFACKGSKEHGGTTVGIIPQGDFSFANKYCDIVIATGLGLARDFVVATSADGVIVVGGGVGTLIELCVAYELKKTIVALSNSGGTATRYAGGYMDDRKTVLIMPAENATTAVNLILENLKL
jgi:uncharacterized protein (TIGR00725 family)